jgi:hypothetical protein
MWCFPAEGHNERHKEKYTDPDLARELTDPARRPARARSERPADDGEPFHDDPLDDVLPFGRG